MFVKLDGYYNLPILERELEELFNISSSENTWHLEENALVFSDKNLSRKFEGHKTRDGKTSPVMKVFQKHRTVRSRIKRICTKKIATLTSSLDNIIRAKYTQREEMTAQTLGIHDKDNPYWLDYYYFTQAANELVTKKRAEFDALPKRTKAHYDALLNFPLSLSKEEVNKHFKQIKKTWLDEDK